MRFKRSLYSLVAIVCVLLGNVSTAWAGVSFAGAVDYAPLAAASAPALGGQMLMLLALLFAVVAYRTLRGRVGGRLLGHLLLGTGIVAGAAAGGDLIRSANAVIPSGSMNMAAGGTVNVGLGLTQLTNTSGVPQQVKALRALAPNASWINPGPSYTPQCTVGMVVAAGGTCYVDLALPAG